MVNVPSENVHVRFSPQVPLIVSAKLVAALVSNIILKIKIFVLMFVLNLKIRD
jgi:hypothetical protein